MTDARHLSTRGRPRQVRRRLGRLSLAALGAASLTACSFGGGQDPSGVPVEVRGSSPVAPGPAAAGGILRYDGYEAAVAQDGDTVASVAARIGLSGSELGAYNGLQPETQLRAGDELVLPPRTGGYGGSPVAAAGAAVPQVPSTGAPAQNPAQDFPSAAAPVPGTADPFASGIGAGTAGGVAVASSGIESAPLDPAGTPAAGSATPTRDAWSPASIEAVLDEPGPDPDAPSDADLGSAAAAAAGTSPPPRAAGTEVASADVASDARPDFEGTGSISPPPSATEPLPADAAAPVPPASPELGQLQTPTPELAPSTDTVAAERAAEEADRAAAEELARLDGTPPPAAAPDLGISFQRPVEGPIVVPYNVSNSGTRNEGVDFGAPAGAPVRAAAGGEVALVSQSLGGLGTIVLVRHRNDVLTVYGRVDDVRVAKGARVGPGDQIGVVARGDGSSAPKMHFEIRRGADSVDPALFVGP